MRFFASLWLFSLLVVPAWGQAGITLPEDTVRRVYKWLAQPAQHKDLKGLYWCVTEEPAVRAHEADFTPEFFQAMRAGFKAGNCDFDFLTCLISQLPVETPSVGVAKLAGADTAVVPVTLNVSYRGTLTQKLQVDVRRIGGVWKIANVRNIDGMDVLKQIRKQTGPYPNG